MKKIIQTPVSLAAEYNLSTTDSKVDFVLDEVHLEQKTTTSLEALPPVIKGFETTAFVVTEQNFDTIALIALVLDGVTAHDVNGVDLTHDLSVDTDLIEETAGIYAGEISVEDSELDETRIPFTVELKAVPTFAGISSGATFEPGTADDALTIEQVIAVVLTGATAEDADETDLTEDLVVDIPGFDGTVAATYPGTVSVTDQWGGTNSININVVIAPGL